MGGTKRGHHSALNPSPVPAASHLHPEPVAPTIPRAPCTLPGLGMKSLELMKPVHRSGWLGGFVFLGSCFFRLGTHHSVPWKGEGKGVTRRPTTTPGGDEEG